MRSYLKENLSSVKLVEPEGTYLLWLDFSALKLDDKKLNRVMIEEAEVALNRGASFGENGSNFMRMNIGSPQSVILEGLERISSVVKRYERI